MKIFLDDDLYTDYMRKAGVVKKTPEALIAETLEIFRPLSPTDRVLVVAAEERSRLEGLLPGGSLTSPADLVARVEALASLRIGDVRLDFTAGQMAELARRADRNGRTMDEEHRRTVKAMEASYFDFAGSR